jgi:hypothetical protein
MIDFLTAHYHDPIICRSCGMTIHAAAGINHEYKPLTGAFSTCLNCWTVSVYEVSPLGKIALREPTDAELVLFARLHGPTIRRLRGERS